MASLQELLNAQSAVADRNRAKDWSARNRAAFGGILDVNQYLPVTGDIQSGILAAQDLGEGAYGSAALNALGLLPFVPAMGGVVKKAGKIDNIENVLSVRPAKEDIYDVANSNFTFGIPQGNKTLSIKSLKGLMSSASDDLEKVNNLAKKMQSPDGYIERLIVDDKGNVIEGQHRLNALKKIGITKVPVTIIKDASNVVENIQSTGMRPEHARQIAQYASEMLKEAGSKEKAMQMFDIQEQYKKAYEIAFDSL